MFLFALNVRLRNRSANPPGCNQVGGLPPAFIFNVWNENKSNVVICFNLFVFIFDVVTCHFAWRWPGDHGRMKFRKTCLKLSCVTRVCLFGFNSANVIKMLLKSLLCCWTLEMENLT